MERVAGVAKTQGYELVNTIGIREMLHIYTCKEPMSYIPFVKGQY